MSLPLIHRRLHLMKRPLAPRNQRAVKPASAPVAAPAKKKPASKKSIPIPDPLETKFLSFFSDNLTPKRRGAGILLKDLIDRLEVWADALGLQFSALPHPRTVAKCCRAIGIEIYRGSRNAARLRGWTLTPSAP